MRDNRYITAPGFGDWLTDLLGLTPGMKAYEDAKKAGVTVSDVVGPTPTTEGMKALQAAAEAASKVSSASVETSKAIIEARARQAAQQGGAEGATQVLVVGGLIALGAWMLLRKK